MIRYPSASSFSTDLLLILSRQHPGETHSSFLTHALINCLCNSQALLEKVEIWIIPMFNPDGVVLGNYRSNLSGRDTNRSFFTATHECSLLQAYLKSRDKKVKMLIDIHTHSSQKNAFIFAPVSMTNRYFPFLMSQASSAFRVQKCKFGDPNNDKHKKHCARLAFNREYKVDLSYTLEISAYGSSST